MEATYLDYMVYILITLIVMGAVYGMFTKFLMVISAGHYLNSMSDVVGSTTTYKLPKRNFWGKTDLEKTVETVGLICDDRNRLIKEVRRLEDEVRQLGSSEEADVH